MIETLLNWLQPVTVLVFVVAAVLSFMLGKLTQGAINVALALCNFVIFYGYRILGK